jgi:hypothetical protein
MSRIQRMFAISCVAVFMFAAMAQPQEVGADVDWSDWQDGIDIDCPYDGNCTVVYETSEGHGYILFHYIDGTTGGGPLRTCYNQGGCGFSDISGSYGSKRVIAVDLYWHRISLSATTRIAWYFCS